MYVEGDRAHITLRVNTQEAVRLSDIQPLLYGFEEIAIAANFPSNIISEIKATELKINVQSPGPIEYIIMSINAWRIASAIKKNGGTLTLKFGKYSCKCKINKPGNLSHDISTDELMGKISNNPKALKRLQEMASAIDKLDAKLPNEKEGQ